MQFPSWREKIRQFFEPYGKINENKKVETQKSIPKLAMTQNKHDDTYKDGTIMLFPTNLSSHSEWYLTRESNPKYISTFSTHSSNNTDNKIVRKSEGNISYWNIKSGIITYKSNNENGRSCRLNIFPSTTRQVNDWHAAVKQGYIGNSRDLKNQEITFVGRLHKTIHKHLETSIKIRGGYHHGYAPDQAACIGISVSHISTGHAARRAKELTHPIYEYEELSPRFEFFTQDNVWFGMKVTSWNNNNNEKDSSVTNRCYIDVNPFLPDGSLRNDYRLYSEWIDHGNGEKYKEIVNWAGGVPITVRIDGWDSVDFYALNAREIIVPE
ncbi:MAG: hypothetical protein JO327_09090 [Nitrososphaeraceae archaeon]|nr:hypothetical protein [Nitrososphaeraceae archaeon]MBV9668270.1 hypothetical protein [Nitrososphaeraceae archaeon]